MGDFTRVGSFERTGSLRTVTADGIRKNVMDAFAEVDTDGNGTIDKQELTVAIRQKLGMQLANPVDDIDVIFATVDDNHNGVIETTEFIQMLEPVLIRNEKANSQMEIEEVLRQVFQGFLNDAKAERALVNQAFSMAHERTSPQSNLAAMSSRPLRRDDSGDGSAMGSRERDMQEDEPDKKGFGVDFWGYTWRFKLYDEFYTNAIDSNGQAVHLTDRYKNLKRRLEEQSSGKDNWIEKVMEQDEKIRMEINNVDGVREYCTWWLRFLNDLEETNNGRKTDKSG